MTGGVGRPLNLRCFAEGVEIPVVSAVVHCGAGIPATAHINIVDTSKAQFLKERTVIHLSNLSNPSAGEAYRYEELFTGEAVGWDRRRESRSRTATLVCVDNTSYWDAAKRVYYDSLLPNYQTVLTGSFMGIKKMGGEDSLYGAVGALNSLIHQNCRTYPSAGGLLGGVIRLMESIGGYQEGNTKTRGLSDFFTCAQARLKLYQQIGAPPADNSCLRLLDTSQFREWLRSLLRKGSDSFTMRQVLDLLLASVFYRRISNPAPYYKSEASSTKTVTSGYGAADDEILARVSQIVSQIENVMQSGGLLTNLSLTFLSHKASKSQWKLLQKAETHALAYNKFYKKYKALQTEAEPATITSTPQARAELDQAYELYKKFLTLYSKAHYTDREIRSPGERLLTTILAPNIFMCPPPVCNVVFPEMYVGMETQRNFLVEATRMMTTTPSNFLGEDLSLGLGLGRQNYFSPDVMDATGKPMRNAALRSKSFIMAHEIFGGPVPYLEFFPDFRDYDPVLGVSGASHLGATYAEQQEQTAKERGTADPVPYLQHVTNFMFVDKRYGPRTMALSMHFNPKFVAGLPALVVEHFPYERGEYKDTDQLLGMPVEVTHVVNQRKGMTRVMMTHVRSHREDAELFDKTVIGVKVPGSTVRRRRSYMGNGTDIVIPRYGGNFIKFEPSRELSAEEAALIQKAKSGQLTPTDIPNPVFDTTLGSGAEPGTGIRLQSIRGRVTVEYTTVKRSSAKIPFEDQVRPPWLSPIYNNSRIGKDVYQELLGVGSIVDAAAAQLDKESKALAGAPTTAKTTQELQQGAHEDGYPGPAGATSRQPVDLSVEACVDSLVSQYAVVRDNGGPDEVDAFIKTYTDRPIATLDEVIGINGFQANAFGEYDKLENLDLTGEKLASDVTGKAPLNIDPRVDPRKARRQAVIDYVLSLDESRSFAD